jgi:DNA modification methylase
MKPPQLYEKSMRRCTKVGDYILDCFGGSGSQLIAAEQLKRRALLIEIDPVFVDLTLLRYEQLTGIKSIKLG